MSWRRNFLVTSISHKHNLGSNGKRLLALAAGCIFYNYAQSEKGSTGLYRFFSSPINNGIKAEEGGDDKLCG